MEDVRTKTNGTTNTNQTGPIVLPALDTSNVTTTTGIDATPAAALQTEAAGGAAGAGGKVPPECRDNSRGLHDDPHSDDSVESGIYVVSTPGGQYVGQSGNISNRLGQHVAKGKFTQEEVDSAQRFAVPGTKLDREVAEQLKINSLGGIDDLLNLVNPIGPKRSHLMPKSTCAR